MLTSWKNSPKKFNITKEKKKTLLESVQETKEPGKKIKLNQIRTDQEQLKNFEKEQEIQLMMNNTYNKKPKSAKEKENFHNHVFATIKT